MKVKVKTLPERDAQLAPKLVVRLFGKKLPKQRALTAGCIEAETISIKKLLARSALFLNYVQNCGAIRYVAIVWIQSVLIWPRRIFARISFGQNMCWFDLVWLMTLVWEALFTLISPFNTLDQAVLILLKNFPGENLVVNITFDFIDELALLIYHIGRYKLNWFDWWPGLTRLHLFAPIRALNPR